MASVTYGKRMMASVIMANVFMANVIEPDPRLYNKVAYSRCVPMYWKCRLLRAYTHKILI